MLREGESHELLQLERERWCRSAIARTCAQMTSSFLLRAASMLSVRDLRASGQAALCWPASHLWTSTHIGERLARRQPDYDRYRQVDTTRLTPEEVADEIEGIAHLSTFTLAFDGTRISTIVFG